MFHNDKELKRCTAAGGFEEKKMTFNEQIMVRLIFILLRIFCGQGKYELERELKDLDTHIRVHGNKI